MIHVNQGFQSETHAKRIMPYLMGVLTLVFCSFVLTVPGWTHGPTPDKQLKRLTKKLGLSEAQQAKIKPILEDKAQQMEPLRQQMKDIRQKSQAQLESELTPEQVTTFKELQKKRNERWKAHKEKHPKMYKGKHNNDDHHDEKHDE